MPSVIPTRVDVGGLDCQVDFVDHGDLPHRFRTDHAHLIGAGPPQRWLSLRLRFVGHPAGG